ncbi:hypothetical protein JGI7_01301 [Candidatus Kryptonium thompsonii]|uniref:Lipoprotein n=1 Tax=Candidatus Kryptonium thompsonii TaxID=1633631 RepID=A0A0P1LYL9_9BACT|nr:hypothetical protein [Candidatus Kryptonium thompsoni]CUS80851.1 hypothetical protein JGI8_00446 [Candidatus Kryptonium thompsoni]CUS87158.1 hypothetical protein JGI13_01410 [Candidatus Kryptonium thompsoni]CUS89289.1 hypothetical protein JGI7_01301 [Candidatus Kryptonium thompsoni]CUS93883.1 hypothetical protein JGI14_10763 [Candidatus Kryptonium thompsoni]CUS94383.1 hypothetical protein JGI15_11162 [Candidatus Kryptonium thompsoni]
MRVIIFTILIFNFIAGCNFPGEVNGDKDDVSRGPFDVAYSVLETGDGYIFAGRTWEKGYNIWVVKIDKQGNILSQNTYGEAQKDEVAYTMDRAADGGYILAGYSKLWSSFNMNSYILKIKADGQKEWEIESSGFVHSEIKNVKATLDGGFVAVGYTTDENNKKKIYVAKFSSNGVKQWERSYYSSHGDAVEGNWIEETGDGGYIVVGAAISLGGLFRLRRDLYILALDQNGERVWDKVWGGIGTPEDEAYCIQKTSDGGYILTGYVVEYNEDGTTNYQLYVVKLKIQDNLVVEWVKVYGGVEHEVGHYIRQTSDGGYIVVGTVDTRDTWVSDIYVLKLDGNGEKVWEKRFGGEYEDGGNFVMEASDGGYIIAGFLGKAITPEMHTEAYIIKLDANGNVSWQRAYTRSIGQ